MRGMGCCDDGIGDLLAFLYFISNSGARELRSTKSEEQLPALVHVFALLVRLSCDAYCCHPQSLDKSVSVQQLAYRGRIKLGDGAGGGWKRKDQSERMA